MTPKEKAEELVEKFSDSNLEVNKEMWDTNGKNCALICVNECLHALDKGIMDLQKCIYQRKYWIEVKQEIEKI